MTIKSETNSAQFSKQKLFWSRSYNAVLLRSCLKHEIHPSMINNWKREAVANMASIFSSNKSEGQAEIEQQTEKLYEQIGQLKVKNDFLEKSSSDTLGRMPVHYIQTKYFFEYCKPVPDFTDSPKWIVLPALQ